MRGFGVRVSAQGRKSWVLRYRTNGRQRRLTLGTFPSLGLAAARASARCALGYVAHGADPATAKQTEQRAGTFRELADLYLEKHAKKRKRSWRGDERILNVELLPVLGATRAKAVTRREIRELVEAIADRGAPIVANRTLALVRKVFNFGLDQEFEGLEGNPCLRITPPGVEQRRDRVLTPDEIKRVWIALDRVHRLTAAVFRLRLLTAQRGGEVLHELRDLLVQLVHARIGMRPPVGQGGLVERAAMRQRLPMLGQPRARRDQQTDGVLHRIHVIDQPVRLDEVKHLAVVLDRRPRRERDPRGTEGNAGIADRVERGDDLFARVLFVEDLEHSIAQRLDRRDDKQAAGLPELGKILPAVPMGQVCHGLNIAVAPGQIAVTT